MTIDGRCLFALSALVLGFGAALAAVPQAVSALSMASSGPTLRVLGQGGMPSIAHLQEAVAARQVALGWYETPAAWAELGALRVALARDPNLSPRSRSAQLDQAVTAFRVALALGPARPYAWSQYAYAVLARDRAQTRIDGPLVMSVVTGPAEPPLVMQRIELGFIADRLLGDAAREAVRGQVGFAARANPDALARFAHAHFALAWVRAALDDDEALLRRFELAYLRRSRL